MSNRPQTRSNQNWKQNKNHQENSKKNSGESGSNNKGSGSKLKFNPNANYTPSKAVLEKLVDLTDQEAFPALGKPVEKPEAVPEDTQVVPQTPEPAPDYEDLPALEEPPAKSVPKPKKIKASEVDNQPELLEAASKMQLDESEVVISYTQQFLDMEAADLRLEECLDQIPFRVSITPDSEELPFLFHEYNLKNIALVTDLIAQGKKVPDELLSQTNISVVDALIREIELCTGIEIKLVYCIRHRNGKDYQPVHKFGARTDEFILSLGAPRSCIFTSKGDSESKTFELDHGDLLFVNRQASNCYSREIAKSSIRSSSGVNLIFITK